MLWIESFTQYRSDREWEYLTSWLFTSIYYPAALFIVAAVVMEKKKVLCQRSMLNTAYSVKAFEPRLNEIKGKGPYSLFCRYAILSGGGKEVRSTDWFDIRWAIVLWSFGRHGPTREWIWMRSWNYFCRQPIKQIGSRLFWICRSVMYMYSEKKDVPARARRENGNDSPSPRSTVQNRPAVLSSGVGSDRTRSNRIWS